MYNYLEYSFTIAPQEPWTDILMAELIEAGFDSFTEKDALLLAYVQKELFNEDEFKAIPTFHRDEVKVAYTHKEMPNINWNAEWEKNFDPINIDDKVYIRAEFHEPKDYEYDIVIQPKMSFGTGHHATTHLMIQQMMNMDLKNKKVLDMGCGTSVLAIFAKMNGAGATTAIDIDEWSVENSKENAERNNVALSIHQGTAESLGDEQFDVILANINRNILISDIPTYVSVLNNGGKLLLSGLCFFDVNDIMEVCKEHGLTLENQIQKEEWVSLLLSN